MKLIHWMVCGFAAALVALLLLAGSARRAEAQAAAAAPAPPTPTAAPVPPAPPTPAAPPASPADNQPAPPAPEEKPAPVVLRLYDVADLVTSIPDRPLSQGVLPPTQLNGILGIRDSYNNYNNSNRQPDPSEQSMESLIKLIEEQVAAETWRDNGGPTASISVREKMLLIRQTEDNQRQAAELLELLRKSRQAAKVVTIHADWLWLNPGDLSRVVKPEKAGAAGREVDSAALQKLGPKALYAHGQITCAGGQTVHLLSGHVKTLVQNLDASVGTGSSAYQPEVDEVLEGAAIQVTPHIQGEFAIVDVLGFVSGWGTPAKPYQIMTQNAGSTPATHPAEPDIAASNNSIATLDRMNLLAQEFCTTAHLPLGKAVIIGGMTLEPEGSGAGAADAKAEPRDAGRQLYLILRVDVE